MSRVGLRLYKSKLNNMLEKANVAEYLQLIWAIDALQSDRERVAARFLSYPEEAVTNSVPDPNFAKKWVLEDLINYALTIDRKNPGSNKRMRTLNCAEYETFRLTYNWFFNMQMYDNERERKHVHILDELTRIGHKQFAWQLGFWTVPHVYRHIYIYSGGKTKAAFQNAYDTELATFFMLGMAYYAEARARPFFKVDLDVSQIGYSETDRLAIIKLIGMPLMASRKLAKKYARQSFGVSYRPSILRDHPLILVGDDEKVGIVPLPELIPWRISHGIYYDVVKLGDEVRTEIGDRFEQYCTNILSELFPSRKFLREEDYGLSKKIQMKTPDIRCIHDGKLILIIECKFKRMDIDAQFGRNSSNNLPDGIGEIVKGVFQIWRYVSHVRRGLVPNTVLSEKWVGLVLTMDPWLSATNKWVGEVLARASKMAAEKDSLILEEDKRPVSFCEIVDLERLAQRANYASMLEVLRASTESTWLGWHLFDLHRELYPDENTQAEYPFKDGLSDLLPMWGRLDQEAHP